MAELVAERAGHPAAARVELLDLQARRSAAGPRPSRPCPPAPSAGSGRGAGRGPSRGLSGRSGTRSRSATKASTSVAAEATRSASGPRRKSRYSSTRVSRQLGSQPTIGVPCAGVADQPARRSRGPGRGRASAAPSRSPAGRSRAGPPARPGSRAASSTRTAARPTSGVL